MDRGSGGQQESRASLPRVAATLIGILRSTTNVHLYILSNS